MAHDQLIADRDGAVLLLRMNNPDRLNALSTDLTEGLVEELTAARDDPDVRAIVLTGEGRGFSAGADLTALQEPYLRGERPRLSEFLRSGYNRLIPLLAETPKPVVAAINGVAAGAGVSLALACDLRIAGESASFTLAFSRIGLVPDSGACWLLPRTVGVARALELALLSERVDAHAAERYGLVSRVVEDHRLADEALALARTLADLPTVGLGLTKLAFQQASRMTLAETLDLEAEIQDQAGATADHLEGVLAFLEKRRPVFTGR
jgi:2-(1,2-epoxy-1,2-dihydrophenyl)acetyl-CoA isomerase